MDIIQSSLDEILKSLSAISSEGYTHETVIAVDQVTG